MRLKITTFDKDPYKEDIPLSYPNSGNGFSFYLEENESLIAIARIYIRDDKGELADIYLNEWYRGKKFLGEKWSHLFFKKVLKAIERRKIISLNDKKLFLWTTKDNFQAISLYKHFLFVEKTIPKKFEKEIKKKYQWINFSDKIYYAER